MFQRLKQLLGLAPQPSVSPIIQIVSSVEPDTENLERRIDNDKRKREAEIAFLLIGLFALAARRAEDAIRVGADPYAAIAGVIMGNAALNMRGGTQRLANLLRASDADGWRRTQRIVPTGETYTPTTHYQSIAAQALANALGSLNRKVGERLARSGGGVTNNVKAVREAVASLGLAKLPDLPKYTAWRANTIAEALVGDAFGRGYWQGFSRPNVRRLLTGFRFSAVLDDATTEICRPRDGISLPPESDWWLRNFPALHWGCRSVIVPRFDKFEPTANPPEFPQPLPGFGRAPATFYGFEFGRPAA